MTYYGAAPEVIDNVSFIQCHYLSFLLVVFFSRNWRDISQKT